MENHPISINSEKRESALLLANTEILKNLIQVLKNTSVVSNNDTDAIFRASLESISGYKGKLNFDEDIKKDALDVVHVIRTSLNLP